MNTLTIHDLDDDIAEMLARRAALHGRSMEEEVRGILRTTLVDSDSGAGLYEAIRARIEPLGGVDLELPARY